MERRRIDRRKAVTALLESGASQANRFEEALLEGWRRGELLLAVVGVDFSHVGATFQVAVLPRPRAVPQDGPRMDVALTLAGPEHDAVLARLFQLDAYDFSEVLGLEISDDGLFPTGRRPSGYWTAPL